MDEKDRIILFLTCCVLTRLFFVYLARYGSDTVLKIMSLVAVIASLGFMTQFIYHPNKRGFFGGQPWWNKLRPVHAALYLLFALMVFYHRDKAWIVLLVDVSIGVAAFLGHVVV